MRVSVQTGQQARSRPQVSGVVTSLDAALPIIVERALYLNAQGQFFSAGHDAVGVTAASTDWFLAEGATGPFFDMYVLIANPNSSAALATASRAGPGTSRPTSSWQTRLRVRAGSA